MAKKLEGGPRGKKTASRQSAKSPRVKARTPSPGRASRASEPAVPRGSRKTRRRVAGEESRSDAATVAPDRDDFHFLVERGGDIFYVADFDCSRFHYISRAYETIWGRSRQSLYDNAHSWFEAVHPNDQERLARIMMENLGRGGAYSFEYRVVHADGGVRWVWDRSYEAPDSRGRPWRVVGLVEDITARKQAEEELARFQELESAARHAAEAAVRVRDEFLSIAAHEFKTPLAALQIQVECLLKGLKEQSLDPKRLEQSVEIANRQVRRLVRLVAGLLDITRISTGRFELETEECDLVEIVADVLARNRYSLERCGCEPELRAPAPVPGRWDRDRIEQIVENLLSNAMKFGQGKPIEIDVRAEGGVGVFRIRDHGAGIEPNLRERIFEPYERGALGPRYGGLGMGLYIAREIVRAHGGKIRTEEPSGEGAVVTVELPAECGG